MEEIIRSRQGRRWHGRSSGYWNEQEGMGGRSSVGHLDQIGASRDFQPGWLAAAHLGAVAADWGQPLSGPVANLGRTDLITNLAFAGSRPTGVATYALNIVPQLFPDRQAVLASVPTGEGVRFPVAANLSQDHGLRGHLRRLLWTQFRLPQICSKLRSQLLFSPIPEAPVLSKCRFVVMFHDTIPLRYPKPKSLLPHYFRYHVPRILHQAEHIVCNSEATASDIMAFFCVPVRKITPILLAYDATHFRPSKSAGSAGWGKRYFLYLGRHDPHKNLNRLITAFASLGKIADCRLLIAGAPDPRYTPLLQTQVEELGLGEAVQFLEYIPYEQLPSLFSEALALVFPSLWEGFGLPVLEAMACGTAVITSSVSSLPEVAGDAAILVDPFDVGAIASAMRSLLNDDDLRVHLGAAGLARAREFSWQRAGKETRAVLDRFL